MRDPKTVIEEIRKIIAQPKLHGGPRRAGFTSYATGIKPRKASTLLVLDDTSTNLKVLMGERNRNLKFMPGALVFPGGAVDRADLNCPVATPLHGDVTRQIADHVVPVAGIKTAKSLGVAALRELAEETGLLVGKEEGEQARAGTKAPPEFTANNMLPDLSSLRLINRAVTPPGPPRRFDTWFFAAPRSAISWEPNGGFAPSGELENLRWVEIEEALVANTMEITRMVLVELLLRLESDPELSPATPVPHYRQRYGTFERNLMF